MRDIRVGIASYGMSGEVFHAPLLHTHQGFQITKILERTKDRSKDRYPYAAVVRNYDDLLRDPQIELIIVNTPDSLHHEMVLQAIEAGKHVVVEKPFTLSVSDADDLIERTKKAGLMLSVFQNRRWDSDFLTIQKIIQDKSLGRLVEFEAHFDRYRNFIQENTWKELTESGSGIIYNLGSHLVDQALVLFGLPGSVFADIRTFRTGGRVDDAFTLLLKYDDVKVTLKASYLVREPGPKYYLHGTLGSFLKWGMDPQEEALKKGLYPGSDDWGKEPEEDWGTINTEKEGAQIKHKVESVQGNYMVYYDQLYEALANGKPNPVPAEQGRDVIRVIEAAKESNNTGQAVKI
ncbi:MAG: oxidoreductase [Bacteroidales bacterium]|nr:oxidoreductase [Bacteroidales bacterium]